MKTAVLVSELSYCKRRQVGAILVKDDRIISIGYNGTPSGWENVCEERIERGAENDVGGEILVDNGYEYDDESI